MTNNRQLDRPAFLRQLSSDEYLPRAYSRIDRRVVARTQEDLARLAAKRRLPLHALGQSRMSTAIGLKSINLEWGEEFYAVPSEALTDHDAASEAFNGPETVIDVQTHFIAPHARNDVPSDLLKTMYRAVMPDWWKGVDEVVSYDLAAYISEIFLKSETAVAILTSGPGLDDGQALFNDEMAAVRALIEGLGGTGRLLNHALVYPDRPNDREKMHQWSEDLDPAGWKVYTAGSLTREGFKGGWMLDDELVGIPFLEEARSLGVNLVCSHKGISSLVDNGSPRDIGPAAKRFPDLSFLVYHSGYEFPDENGIGAEGPYTEQTAHLGVNRLITTALESGVGRGENIYAELGTTWFSLIRRPVEAAHVLGKLLNHFGPDNVIWGTDSIWYGDTQAVLDAFRAFDIPERMCDEFGYSPITPSVKERILSLNAARVYNIDLPVLRDRVKNDELSWARQLMSDLEESDFAGLR